MRIEYKQPPALATNANTTSTSLSPESGNNDASITQYTPISLTSLPKNVRMHLIWVLAWSFCITMCTCIGSYLRFKMQLVGSNYSACFWCLCYIGTLICIDIKGIFLIILYGLIQGIAISSLFAVFSGGASSLTDFQRLYFSVILFGFMSVMAVSISLCNLFMKNLWYILILSIFITYQFVSIFIDYVWIDLFVAELEVSGVKKLTNDFWKMNAFISICVCAYYWLCIDKIFQDINHYNFWNNSNDSVIPVQTCWDHVNFISKKWYLLAFGSRN